MFGFCRKKKPAREPSARCPAVAAMSERGLVRADNQDHFFADASAGFFCVADGMGGGDDGAEASRIVCEKLKCAAAGGADQNRIGRALQEACAEIFSHAQAHGFSQMGSTAAVLMLNADGKTAEICHVGDSRIYRIRRGLCAQLTRDHTVGQEMGAHIDRRRVAEFKDRANPLSHILTRAVGTQQSVRPEWAEIEVLPADRYVICSDGVHDVVSPTRLAALVASGPVAKAKERLSAEVLRCGAPDNFTFIIVEVSP